MFGSTRLCCYALLVACLTQIPDGSSAFHKKQYSRRSGYKVQRRSQSDESTQVSADEAPTYVSFDTKDSIGPLSNGTQYESVGLHCKAMGSPPPVIHWLKNGIRVKQRDCRDGGDDTVDYEGTVAASSGGWLKIGGTVSTLYIDCLEEDDEANYTCVAETPTHRETLTTIFRVEPSMTSSLRTLRRCASKGSPARIFMATRSRLEYIDNTVQLFCRAQGNPKPTITWYDSYNNTVQNGGNYRIMPSGDLVIENTTWEDNMGVYTCIARNKYGSDSADPFLYPTLTSPGGGGWPFGV